jgi:putative addiction module component (TIGR02574 family)
MLRPVVIQELDATVGNMTMQKLKDQVLALPEHERAELVYDVIASLDGPADENVEEAWAREIESRLAELEAGTAQTVDANHVMQRVAARLRSTK